MNVYSAFLGLGDFTAQIQADPEWPRRVSYLARAFVTLDVHTPGRSAEPDAAKRIRWPTVHRVYASDVSRSADLARRLLQERAKAAARGSAGHVACETAPKGPGQPPRGGP